MGRILSNIIAAGDALTNSTDETVLASYSFGNDFLEVGNIYRLSGSVRATATNGTDTLQVRIRIGSVTLTGTVVADSTAVDVADNDVVNYSLDIIPRSVGSTGSAIIAGFISAPGAESTATARVAFHEIASLDTTGTIFVDCTGQWSAASASDSCQAESFSLIEISD